MSWRYLIVGTYAVRTAVAPVTVVAFKTVAVADAAMVLEVQGSKLYGKGVVAVVERHLIGIADGQRSPVWLIVGYHVNDEGAVAVVGGLQLFRNEGEDALLAANPQVTVGTAECGSFFHLHVRDAVIAVEITDALRLLVVAGKPRLRSQPEMAVQVFDDRVDDIITQSFTGTESASAQLLQSTAKGAYPYLTALVGIERIDVVVGKGGIGLVAVGLEDNIGGTTETATGTHESVDSSYPQAAVLVLHDVAHLGIKAIGRIVFQAVMLVIERQPSVLLADKVQATVQRTHPDVVLGVREGHVHIVTADAGGIVRVMSVMHRRLPDIPCRCGVHQHQTVALG